MNLANFVLRALVPLLVTGLAGCTKSLLDSEAPVAQVYVLAPVPAQADGVIAGAEDVVVAVRSTAPGLNTERIAVLHPDRRLEYYAGARWGSTAGNVMQAVLVGSLQNSHLFHSVTASPAGTAATHIIDFELRDFQAEYPAQGTVPAVHVAVVANVLRVADRRLLAVIPASITVPAAENRLSSVMAAFELAARQVAETLGRGTATALSADAGRGR